MSTNNITPEFASAYVQAVARTRDVLPDAENSFHKNSYATLSAHISATKGIFAQYDLAIVQFPFGDDKQVGVNTMVIHKDGGYIQNYITLPVAEGVKGQDVGSLVSYLRRYAIAGVANLATSDDDGEADRQTHAQPMKQVNMNNFAKEQKAIEKAYEKINDAEIKKPVSGNPDLSVVLHFGKNKGKTLGELPKNSLDWYIKEFQAKPYNGKLSPQDVALREALDRLAQGHTKPEADTSDDVPF
jgi:uncharacterized protein (DUF3820 family)